MTLRDDASEEATIGQKTDYAKAIFTHNQNLVNFVDTKAGVILAVDGAILAILASSSTALNSGYEQLALGAALLLIGISALFGFLIIKPRISEASQETKIFYRSILAKSRDDFKISFTSSPREILDDYLNNIYTLATIQKKKFFYLEESLYCLLLGLVPLIVLVVSVH